MPKFWVMYHAVGEGGYYRESWCLFFDSRPIGLCVIPDVSESLVGVRLSDQL